MGDTPSSNEIDQQHTVHRIEAFSDIVMGFCLAEAGLSLILPRDAAAFDSIGGSIAAFVVSFTMMVVLWWIHHRIFKTYFVLSAPALVMNFAMLGALILMLFFLQTTVHFIHTGQNPEQAIRFWFFSFAAVYALLAGILALGLRAKWRSLEGKDLEWGLNRAVQLGMTVLILIAVGITVVGMNGKQLEYTGFGAMFVTLVVGRVLLPQVVKRFIGRRV